MGIDSELLSDCEEFFEMIENELEDVRLDLEIDNLRVLIEQFIDGWTTHTDYRLAHIAQVRLHVIWDLISKNEKEENFLLGEYYAELMVRFRAICGSEPDFEDEL